MVFVNLILLYLSEINKQCFIFLRRTLFYDLSNKTIGVKWVCVLCCDLLLAWLSHTH